MSSAALRPPANTNLRPFSIPQVAHNASADLHQSADGEAFAYALQYPFRAGAAKAILAVRSDVLQRSANPVKQLTASLINTLAQHSGIQLHLIEPVDGGAHGLRAPADFKSGGAVVGFDAHTVLGLDAVQKKTRQVTGGTQEQRDALQWAGHERDLGAHLVQTAGGYVFDSTAWTAAKPADQKRWLAVVAAALADRLARTEVRLDCRCAVHDGVWSADRCTAMDAKQKPQIVSVDWVSAPADTVSDQSVFRVSVQ